jgi:hypothetical protein
MAIEPLERAFREAGKLPTDEQEILAALIMEELASERRWQAELAASQDSLDCLAKDALAEHRQGKSKPLDPDRL